MAKEGIFIVIEGGEGSGKSTQAARLKEYLPARYPDREFVFTREPGGTPLADQIRAAMTSPEASNANGATMLGLIMASRSHHTEQLILPSLAAGKVVISDRYLASSYAYQLAGQDSAALAPAFWAYAALFPIPDLYIYLEIEPASGRTRAEARTTGSHFHARPLGFHEKVQAGYREYFSEAGLAPALVDANRDIEEVWRDVQKAVESVLN